MQYTCTDIVLMLNLLGIFCLISMFVFYKMCNNNETMM